MNRVYKKSIMFAVSAALLFVFLIVFTNVRPVHAAGNNAKDFLGKAIYAESGDSDEVTWFSGGVGLNYTDGLGTWLDPYNLDLRTWIAEMVQELYDLGFDEKRII